MYTQAMGNGSSFGGNGHSSPTAEMPSYFQGSATAEHPFLDQTGEVSGLTASTSPLMQVEIDALLYMREEEKLARDVYNVLYAKWGIPVFQNIAASEQTHMDAIMTLLDRYGLADPASSQAGMFNDPTLQRLYTELDAGGNLSLGDALKAGAAIEEIDILDLQSRLAQVDNPDIIQVFNNLLNGSFNHLRAFVSALKIETGEAYIPRYLTQDAYQAIIEGASTNRGAAMGMGQREVATG